MKRMWAYFFLLWVTFILKACDNDPGKGEMTSSMKRPTKDYIRKIPGENDSIPEEIAQKGEVLIAYSDCYTCHSQEKRAKGPLKTSHKGIPSKMPILTCWPTG
jgi:cytochrome c